MSFDSQSGFLRRVLFADAISSAAMGVLLLSFNTPLAAMFALPVELLREAGWILLPFAGFVAYVASRAIPSRKLVWTIMGLNAVWIVDSVLLLFSESVEPNAFGQAFVVAQAIFVLVMTELEYMGLKRSMPTAR
ncbi:MAG: hypothetical protein ACJ8MH_19420 [Povalibacter sp.]